MKRSTIEDAVNEIKSNNNKNLLPIAGIGASAGGLNALREFFRHVPADSGLAWVVVVHLSPEHKSMLAELLQPHVKMQVKQVTETMKLEPNNVYVIPPNANLNTIDTHLRLSELEPKRSERAPIDHFFYTLAKTHKSKAIGIVLTGTGSDGTLGIKEIKAHEGLTIVQNPEEAEYDGMPQSAIATGIIDLVLPLTDIPSHVISYLNTTPKIPSLENGKEPDGDEHRIIQKIFAQVRARTGRDFSGYKTTTIMRRLERRMQIYRLENLDDYLELLQSNQEEIKLLSDDFLINVTSFYRDPEVFRYLGEKVISKIIFRKKPDEQLRVWSIGCATGEEAYSLAMLLAEAASRVDAPPSVQVFATDLHQNSLKKARDGFFPGDIQSEVSPERLNRFFTRDNGGYRVKKELREMVIFTHHNLLNDPPFSKIDLIVCRNLLIYLKKDVQKDVLGLFHYSLKPGGSLILGPSESIDQSELFTVDQKDFSVYSRKNVAGPEPRLPVFPKMKYRFSSESTNPQPEEIVNTGEVHQKMAERFGPPSILISSDYQLLHVSENAGRYLQMPGGPPERDIFRLIRKEMAGELRTAIHTSKEKKKAVRSKPLSVLIEGKKRMAYLSVRYIESEEDEDLILVLFEEYDEPEITSEIKQDMKNNVVFGRRIEDLENELRDKRQQLQAIIKEFETSREEMKASNEELQSTNEELRSTMEELETSKEELQSVNEELSTLNQENRNKVEELSQLSDDLQNLFSATDIATLFLSRELRIMRFTPSLSEIFNIRVTDQGRPISDITNRVGYNELIDDAQKVLARLQTIEREITGPNNNVYLTRLMPYRNSEEKIDGVVITFIDITERKKAELQSLKNEERMRILVDAMFNLLFRMTPDWSVMIELEGKGFLADTVKPDKRWMSKYIHRDDRVLVKEAIRKALKSKELFELEYRVILADGTTGWVRSRALPIRDEKGKIIEWLGVALDITAQKEWAQKLQDEKTYAESIVETLHEPVLVLNPDLTVRSVNAAFLTEFQVKEEETIGRLIYNLGNDQWRIPRLKNLLEDVLPDSNAFNNYEVEHDFEQIGKKTMLLNARRLDHVQLILLSIQDITEQKQYEQELRKAKDKAEEAALIKEQFLAHMSHEIRTPLNAIVGLSYLLLEQPHNENQMISLSTIRTAAENLHQLINDILDYSKLKSGKWKLSRETVNLRKSINDLIIVHQPFVKDKNVKLELHIEKDIPEYIVTDEPKLMHVLNNLVGNAVKFTDQGVVKVDVKLNRRKYRKLWLEFSVSDTGIGMNEKQLNTIFDEFTQADPSTIKRYKGTGLGLSIVKMYLQIMESEIRVESTPGKGSRFWFELPVKEVSEIDGAVSEPVKLLSGVDIEDARLLIVEDDDFSRMMLSQILNMWGLQHDEAVNGKDALELAKKNDYHIVFIDVHMPVMDGFEATRILRKMKNYKNKPIYAVTADVSKAVTEQVNNNLFSGKIIKPFEPDELHEVIKGVLGGREDLELSP